ncbi:MAG: DUF4388 domain-containing protein [Thermodesulfobacteriota bacterium]
MQLKGSFESTSLASILQMLHNDSKTGELKLTSGEREVVLFLRQGNVVFVRGSGMETRVGTLLRSKGIITAQQLQEALAVARDKKQILGKTLVEMGFITEDMLRKVLHKQAEDLIFAVFLWEAGQFDYNDVGPLPTGLQETRLDIMGVILEATRRIDEMRVLRKGIESDQIIFRISDRFGEKERLKFNAIEWRFLSLIDGTRSVRQLIFESGYEDFAVYKVLNSLLSFKLIERVEPAGAAEGSGESAYGPTLAIYLDVLQEIAKAVETELMALPYRVVKGGRPVRKPGEDERRDAHRERLRQWLNYLICSAKPAIEPDQADIFKSYIPDQPPDVFLHAATEAMLQVEDPEQGNRFLADAMLRLMENFLLSLRKVIGRTQARQVLRETSRILRFVARYQKEQAEKTGIVKEVEKIVRSVEQSLRTGPRKAREGGLTFTVDLRYEPVPVSGIRRAEGPPLKAPKGVGTAAPRKKEMPVIEAQVVEPARKRAVAPEKWDAPAAAAARRPSAARPAARAGHPVPSPREEPVAAELEEIENLDDLEELDDAPREITEIPSFSQKASTLEELDPVEAAARELEAAFDPAAMGAPAEDDLELPVAGEEDLELPVVGDLEDVDEDDLEPMGGKSNSALESKPEPPQPRPQKAPPGRYKNMTGIEAPGLEEALEMEGNKKAGNKPEKGGKPANLDEWEISQDEILEMED